MMYSAEVASGDMLYQWRTMAISSGIQVTLRSVPQQF
jgi:hypothetical protein